MKESSANVFRRAIAEWRRTCLNGRDPAHAWLVVTRDEWLDWVVDMRCDPDNVQACGIRLVVRNEP